jgi:hypothetical protein
VAAPNSHLCRAGVNLPRTEPKGPRHKRVRVPSTSCAGSSAQSPPCGVDVRTFSPGSWATGREAGVTNHHSQITIHPQAKKKLIATHANSKIAITHSQHRTSLFLTATKTAFPRSVISPCLFTLRRSEGRASLSPAEPRDVAKPPWFGRLYSFPLANWGNASRQMALGTQGNPSRQTLFVSQGKGNYLAGFAIVSLGASGVPEVYNPGRFLRRFP